MRRVAAALLARRAEAGWVASSAAVGPPPSVLGARTATAATTTPTSTLPPRDAAALQAAQAADGLDFGDGRRLPYTTTLTFYGGPGRPTAPAGGGPIPAFWTVDGAGAPIAGAPPVPLDFPDDGAAALAVYASMARLQVMDTLFFEAQRQGRFSFYMTAAGEEAATVASAAALQPNDPVFAQYREHGVLLHRGAPFKEMADQCYGSRLDRGKGRQMPIHYGDPGRAFHTVSSPLATQLPHAVGAAYAGRLWGQQGPTPASSAPPGTTVVAAYFGEGAASEGDFHAALNFAAVLRAPVVFICRNNGWAISTPATQQYAGDGIAGRGPAYGVPSARVDGGDARAVHAAVAAARAVALATGGPALVECVAYRAGHHSTSDDAARYRSPSAAGGWRARDPAARFARWLEGRGWWDGEREAELRRAARAEAVEALAAAEKEPKSPLTSMFDDVYATPPWHLVEQREAAVAHARAHPGSLPAGVSVE